VCCHPEERRPSQSEGLSTKDRCPCRGSALTQKKRAPRSHKKLAHRRSLPSEGLPTMGSPHWLQPVSTAAHRSACGGNGLRDFDRNPAGLAGKNDRKIATEVVQACFDLVQRTVDGAWDVAGSEFGGGADIHEQRRGRW